MTKAALPDQDQDKRVNKDEYRQQLQAMQAELERIQTAYIVHQERAIIVFEGWDAAGKGGVIKRITATLDPRGYKVWPIAAPDERERKRHYLYRFWKRLPGKGEIAIFDRSWYGRVLVERVEGFCKEAAWQRAYNEINDFEKTLIDNGSRILKYFLHISPNVQRERFEDRLNTPGKHWKLTMEDIRNRAQWNAYEAATLEMLERTSTKQAPWRVIPFHQKKYGRLQVMRDVIDRLREDIDMTPAPVDPDIASALANDPHD
ncbi:MAG: polyphosphate kinase [Pseudomonadota bacterium]